MILGVSVFLKPYAFWYWPLSVSFVLYFHLRFGPFSTLPQCVGLESTNVNWICKTSKIQYILVGGGGVFILSLGRGGTESQKLVVACLLCVEKDLLYLSFLPPTPFSCCCSLWIVKNKKMVPISYVACICQLIVWLSIHIQDSAKELCFRDGSLGSTAVCLCFTSASPQINERNG